MSVDNMDVFEVKDGEIVENEKQEISLIPTGKRTLHILEFDISKKMKSKNSKTLAGATFRFINITFYDKKIDRLLKVKFSYSSDNRKNYINLIKAGKAEAVPMGEGGVTFFPAHKHDEDPKGIVGRAINVTIEHALKEKQQPKKDDGGNVVTDGRGKWIWETVLDEDGNPKVHKVEEIKKDEFGAFIFEESDQEPINVDDYLSDEENNDSDVPDDWNF